MYQSVCPEVESTSAAAPALLWTVVVQDVILIQFSNVQMKHEQYNDRSTQVEEF